MTKKRASLASKAGIQEDPTTLTFDDVLHPARRVRKDEHLMRLVEWYAFTPIEMPTTRGPVWDLNQNPAKYIRRCPLLPSMLPQSYFWSSMLERQMLKDEHCLVQGYVLPRSRLVATDYMALFSDMPCSDTNLRSNMGQAFHAHICGALLLFLAATVVECAVFESLPAQIEPIQFESDSDASNDPL